MGSRRPSCWATSRHKEDHIARRSAARLSHGTHLVGRVELVDRRLDGVGLDADPDQPLGTHLRPLDELGQRVDLLAGVGGASRSGEAADILRIVEHAEPVPLDAAGHVVELHAEAQVRLVRSVLLHRLDPRHPAERLGEVDAQHLAEHMLRPALEHFQHVLLLDERHFAVDLREFGLTVGAQILVAEAAHDLEIFVVTGHHEQLFERLRRLRQRIELVGVHAARHHEVARPLGRGLDQVGGFDFEESLPVEERAHGVRHPVPQDQRPLQRRPAQVEVAVFHAQVVAAVRLLLDREGRNVRAVEDHERIGRDLDLARGQLGILRLAFDDAARHLQDEFAAQFGGRPAGLFGRVLLDDDLRQAVAVAQVDEGHGAQVAHLLHPAGERHRLADVRGTQRTACMGSVHNNLYLLLGLAIFVLAVARYKSTKFIRKTAVQAKFYR